MDYDNHIMLSHQRFILTLGIILIGASMFLPAPSIAESYIGSDMSLSDGLWVYKPESGRDGHGFVGIGITDAKTLPVTPNSSVSTPNLAIVGNVKLHGSLVMKENSHTDTGGSPSAVDWRRSNYQQLQLTTAASAWTINFAFHPPGPAILTLVLRYTPSSGSYGAFSWTASNGPVVKFPGGVKPLLSTANASTVKNKQDILTFFYDGTNYYGIKKFSTL